MPLSYICQVLFIFRVNEFGLDTIHTALIFSFPMANALQVVRSGTRQAKQHTVTKTIA